MLKGANAEVTIEQFDVDTKDIAILKPVTVHEAQLTLKRKAVKKRSMRWRSGVVVRSFLQV
ncbi:MAG TPA: hypothetical protein VF393_06250 [archaeon]